MTFMQMILAAMEPKTSPPPPFLLYARLCDAVGDHYLWRKAARVFYHADKQWGLSALLREDPTEDAVRSFCAEKLAPEEAELLTEAFFPPEPPVPAPVPTAPPKKRTAPAKTPAPQKAPRKNPAPPKAPRKNPSPQKRAAPRPAADPFAGLDENVLLHYASSDPFAGSDNTLHVDFDCPRLANAYLTFQQPLFELKAQGTPWKLCPHCAKATPLRFSGKRGGPYDVHLKILSERDKKKARKNRP